MQPDPSQPSHWLDLAARTCVVTGAASSVGAETARQLAAAGARVALLDRNGDGARAVAAEIERDGHRAIGLACDVSSPDGVQAAAAAAAAVQRALGPCRVLVNNAAAIDADALLNVRLDKWNDLLAVNLSARCCAPRPSAAG